MISICRFGRSSAGDSSLNCCCTKQQEHQQALLHPWILLAFWWYPRASLIPYLEFVIFPESVFCHFGQNYWWIFMEGPLHCLDHLVEAHYIGQDLSRWLSVSGYQFFNDNCIEQHPSGSAVEPSSVTNFKQPNANPITEYRLMNDVCLIYAGLVSVEKKFMKFDKDKLNRKSNYQACNGKQWYHCTKPCFANITTFFLRLNTLPLVKRWIVLLSSSKCPHEYGDIASIRS